MFFLSYLFSGYWLGGLLPLFDLYGDYLLAYASRDGGVIALGGSLGGYSVPPSSGLFGA